MEKLVSIIIPAYNIEKCIERCLDSVVSQIYKNLEIIVVDDGSTDRTGEILDAYQKKDSRILLIHKKNGGVSSARNCGLDIAAGDYIGFVDGDDVIAEDMYSTLVKMIEEENADIAHCGYQMVFPKRVDYYYNTKKKKIQTQEEGIQDLIEGKFIEPALVTKLYKRKIVGKKRLNTQLKINEDLMFNYELFKGVKKSVYYDVTPYSYMIRGNSATSSNSMIQKNRDSLVVLNTIQNDASKQDKTEICAAVYRRKIYLLMSICRASCQDQVYVQYQKEKKLQLKKESKTKQFHQYIDTKLKYMTWFTLYCPWLFRIVYKIYDLKTGVSKKYSIE